MKRHPTRMAAVTLAGIVLAAQASAQQPMHRPAAAPPHPMPGMHQAPRGMSEGSRELHQAMMGGMRMPGPMTMTGDVDTDFATMMTMHHRQPIQMSDVLLKHSKNAQLRALAQKMKASQLEEIRTLAPYAARK